MTTTKRHSWINIGHGKKECVTCGLIRTQQHPEPGKTTVHYHYKNIGIEMNNNPGCK